MNIQVDRLINYEIKKIPKNSIIFDREIRGNCAIPYYLHPFGCINFNCNPLCPPKSEYLENKVLNSIYSEFYLLLAFFNLELYITEQKEKLKRNNKIRSERQIKCCYLWENTIRKNFKTILNKSFYDNPKNKLFILAFGCGFELDFQEKVQSMESCGLDVYQTYENNHIEFEVVPRTKVVMSSLICSDKILKFQKQSTL